MLSKKTGVWLLAKVSLLYAASDKEWLGTPALGQLRKSLWEVGLGVAQERYKVSCGGPP